MFEQVNLITIHGKRVIRILLQLIRKYMKTMISTLKSLILINSVKKKSPSGGPPTGGHLRRWADGQTPAARCAGAKMREKFQFF